MEPLILYGRKRRANPASRFYPDHETQSSIAFAESTMRRATFPLAGLIIVLAAIVVMPKITGLLRNHEQKRSLASLESQSNKRAAWQTLLKFQNQSLSKLAKVSAEELQKAIDELVGKRENEIVVPRLVTTISDSKGQTRYALIEESPLLMIPGNSGISVHVFAEDGSLIRSAVFQTGWRIFVTDIRVAYLEESGTHLDLKEQVPEVSGMPPVAHEDISEARLVRDLLNSEAVRRDIKTLMLSQNLWVRQGAKLADNPESYSWGIKIR